jgi:hypothetical protein
LQSARACFGGIFQKLTTRAAPTLGGRGSTPDYDSTQHANVQRKAKRSGQAEGNGEGEIGGLLRLRQSSSYARRRRPSRVQQKRWVRGFSPATTIQLARTLKKTMPSAATRPSAAERGVRESPPATAI